LFFLVNHKEARAQGFEVCRLLVLVFEEGSKGHLWIKESVANRYKYLLHAFLLFQGCVEGVGIAFQWEKDFSFGYFSFGFRCLTQFYCPGKRSSRESLWAHN
jgi:hypothetical protein